MNESDFTVAEFIEMLKKMPQDAKLYIEYKGYYEPMGGPVQPSLDTEGLVVIGEVDACP